RRPLQPVEMFVELENSTVIQAQPFPDCVAALHCRIERADPCFVTMHQLPVDIDDQVAVSLIEFLQHLKETKLIRNPRNQERIFKSSSWLPVFMIHNNLCWYRFA